VGLSDLNIVTNQSFKPFEGQVVHAISLGVLLFLTWFCWRSIAQPSPILFWLAVAIPVVHQVFVAVIWRIELVYRSVSMRNGFEKYLFVFFVLFVSRFITLVIVGWADQNSLGLTDYVQIVLVVCLLLPGLYAVYSVKRYFGFARAAGADHFDDKYREMPLVKQGIFKYTQNGMYKYAFLLFWCLAVVFNSKAAVVVALFSHVYIWVHYFCTEKPDMEFIYGDHVRIG